jgi:hypothetical protein
VGAQGLAPLPWCKMTVLHAIEKRYKGRHLPTPQDFYHFNLYLTQLRNALYLLN